MLYAGKMSILQTYPIVQVAPGSLVQIPCTDIKLRILVDRGQFEDLEPVGDHATILCVDELCWELRRIAFGVQVNILEEYT